MQLTLDSGKNIFFTGCAGTGSHFCFAFYRTHVALTATTGIAARNLGKYGMTLHSWAGLVKILREVDAYHGGNVDTFAQYIWNKLDSSPKKRWRSAKVLIVDEVSMLSKGVLETEALARIGRNSTEKFGGIQLIFSGDFLQLPPVKGEFAFQSRMWSDLFPGSLQLYVVHRQEDN